MSHFGLKATNAYGETLRMHGTHKVLSAEVSGNRVTIVRQFESNMSNSNGAVADRVVKEIYDMIDGNLELIDTVEGAHTPAHYVQETISFPR